MTPGDALHHGQSTVYPMLYNLETKGLILARLDESWARPRKQYTLTSAGKKRLSSDAKQWQTVTVAMEALGFSLAGVIEPRWVAARAVAIVGGSPA
jgi:PadR family transcriptional regulator PadR